MVRFPIAPVLAAISLIFAPAQAAQMLGAPYGPNTVPDGITVRGSGTASTMADQATISLRLFGRNNALVVNQAAMQPVIDALVKAGVQRSDITTPVYLTGTAQSNAVLTAIVRHPTVPMLQSGIASLASVFPVNSPVLVSAADVRLSAADCAAARAQAQSAAIRQARSSAEAIAHDLRVRVGPVIAVDFQNNASDSSGGCFSMYSIGPYQTQPFSAPEDYLRVRVSSFVTIRYAIK